VVGLFVQHAYAEALCRIAFVVFRPYPGGVACQPLGERFDAFHNARLAPSLGRYSAQVLHEVFHSILHHVRLLDAD
jgi:hypothetical protein